MWNKIKEIIRWPYKKYLKYAFKLHIKESNKNPILRNNDFDGFNPFTILQFYLILITLFVITGSIIMGIILIING